MEASEEKDLVRCSDALDEEITVLQVSHYLFDKIGSRLTL